MFSNSSVGDDIPGRLCASPELFLQQPSSTLGGHGRVERLDADETRATCQSPAAASEGG